MFELIETIFSLVGFVFAAGCVLALAAGAFLSVAVIITGRPLQKIYSLIVAGLGVFFFFRVYDALDNFLLTSFIIGAVATFALLPIADPNYKEHNNERAPSGNTPQPPVKENEQYYPNGNVRVKKTLGTGYAYGDGTESYVGVFGEERRSDGTIVTKEWDGLEHVYDKETGEEIAVEYTDSLGMRHRDNTRR